MRVREGSFQLLALLGVFVHHLQVIAGSCPPLAVPSFGQLVFNGSDVTQSQPTVYSENATVEYRCAQGYGLSSDDSVSTCMMNGNWSLVDVTCQLLPTEPTVTVPVNTPELDLLVPAREAMIIIGAVLGTIVLLLFSLVICCWCWALKMRAQLRGGEEAFSQSQQGAFIVSNPLMVIRDDEPSGDPLYLTPSEMTEFDRLGSHNTSTRQQKTKHK